MFSRALVAISLLIGVCSPAISAADLDNGSNWKNYQSLAESAYKDGNYVKARQLYELCLRESDELKDSSKIINSLEGLAASYCQLDQMKDAQPLYERALELAKAQRGEKTSAVVSLMLDLASCYESNGNHRKSEPIYTKVLQLNEEVNGSTADSARTLHRIALHYSRRNNLDQSRRVMTKAMSLYENSLGASHPESVACARDLADVSRRIDHISAKPGQGKSNLEQNKPEQASLRAPLTAPVNSTWSTTLTGVAEVAAEKQQNESQIVLNRAPVESVGPMFGTLVSVRASQKRYDEAEPLYKKVIEIDEQSLGADHPGLAADLNNLAMLYQAQKRFNEAIPLFKRSIDIYTKAYGAENLAVVTSKINLASSFEGAGRFAEADAEYRAALDASRKLRSGGQYQTARILNAMGYLYFQQGKLNEADTAYGQAVDACEQAYGSNSKLFAACLDDYAKVMRALNKAADAEQLENRAARIFTLTAAGN